MSSRRKSSTPCMVRVVSDMPEEQDDPGEVTNPGELSDKAPAKAKHSESLESSEKQQKSQHDNLVSLDQQSPATVAEEQNLEPFPQEHHPPVIQELETSGAKDKEETESDQASQKKVTKGYECKYCPFSTHNLNDFKGHVDSKHPNVILNPMYHCAVCDFKTKKFDSLTEHNESEHPGETNFKFRRVKMNNQTILEQTIEGKDNSANCETTNERGEISNHVFARPCVSTAVKSPSHVQSLFGGGDLQSQLDGLIQSNQIAAVNINGTVIIPEPTMLQGLSHVTPMLQRPPNFNCVPKIAVPLNTTKYNPSLDDNLTLIASFNKFPYPTHAELSWLTAASKHPEEQIKVWFTTQRLKQGITWSPEEVEEARKKMFNGSIPPAHHTFTVLSTNSISESSAKLPKQPVVHTTVENPGHIRKSMANGASVTTSTYSPTTGLSHGLKRSLPAHLSSAFGPELKRPIMAVAPHSGDPKDKILMAPPPPPPPQKDRFPMSSSSVRVETRRSALTPLVNTDARRQSVAVPLMPPPSSTSSLSSSSSSKGKSLSLVGNTKTKPVVSIPSIVFPESLTRPMIAPPPISAPPFKNSLLVPRAAPFNSKEKHANTHTLPTPDISLPNSPPLVNSQIRRPTIIQSIRTPAKTPTQVQGFPADVNKLKEPQGVDIKTSYPKGDKVTSHLAETNGKPHLDGNWSQDQTMRSDNNGMVHVESGEPPVALKSDFQQKASVMTQFPLLERMKGKSAKQLKVLEESFLRNSFPTKGDVDNLASTTGLSYQEIESWFVERRALRDNLEQALLNSMGTKRIGGGAVGLAEKKLQQQHQTLQLNGIHKLSTCMSNLKSPPPPLHALSISTPRPVVPSTPKPNSCLVPPDSQSLALLKDDFAQTQWPFLEEFSQFEGQPGLPRSELSRWFTDTRLQSSGVELKELFHKNGLNGGHGQPVSTLENTPSGILQACQDRAVSNNSSRILEMDLGWLMDQRSKSFTSFHHTELQDRFAGRLRQQSAAELKNGVQTWGVMGGARDVFGSWLEDGHFRRGRELLLDRERKMAEETSGRLTG